MFALKNLDWKLNAAALFLMAGGLVNLLNVQSGLFWKQAVWIMLGLFACFLMVVFNWRAWLGNQRIIWLIYVVSIFLLVITFLMPATRGAHRWIPLGGFKFQTSLFAALSLIIVLANFFRKKHKNIANPLSIIQSFFIFLLPAALVFFQPDAGSMLVLFLIWISFVLVSGIPGKHLLIIGIIFLLTGVIMWNYFLKDYHKQRIIGLFFPGHDVLGINYNTIQSKIAIGSAGIFGKGFQQGTQARLGFLPEADTDFIFASFIEEWGMAGGFLLIAAVVFLIFRIINIGLNAQNNFNKFICLGSAVFFFANFIFNAGSNTGLLPVVGVPYPLVSYGGSHIIVELILLGMAQWIKISRI